MARIKGKREAKSDTPSRSAKQVTRRRRREQDTRVQGSMEEVRAHQAEIEARLRVQGADGPAAGAQYAELTRRAMDGNRTSTQIEPLRSVDAPLPETAAPVPDFPEQDLILTEDGRVAFRPKPPKPEFIFNAAMRKKLSARGGNDQASVVGTARHMLWKGYRIDAVLDKTGARFEFLADLPIGKDGRIPQDKRDDY